MEKANPGNVNPTLLRLPRGFWIPFQTCSKQTQLRVLPRSGSRGQADPRGNPGQSNPQKYSCWSSQCLQKVVTAWINRKCEHKMMNFDTIRALVSLLFPSQASNPHPEWDPHWIQLLWIKDSLQGAYSQVWEYLYPHITSDHTEVLMVQRELQRIQIFLVATLDISQSSCLANQNVAPKKIEINQSQSRMRGASSYC